LDFYDCGEALRFQWGAKAMIRLPQDGPVDVVLVHRQMYCHAKTERALLVSENGDKRRAIWLPLSQISVKHDDKSKTVDLWVPEWLAIKDGLV
jgi:hypothetical protein